MGFMKAFDVHKCNLEVETNMGGHQAYENYSLRVAEVS